MMKYLELYKNRIAKAAVNHQQLVTGVVDLRLKVDSSARLAVAELVVLMDAPPSRRFANFLMEPFRCSPGQDLWARETDVLLMVTREIRWGGERLELISKEKVAVLWQAFTCGPGSASEMMRFYEKLFEEVG